MQFKKRKQSPQKKVRKSRPIAREPKNPGAASVGRHADASLREDNLSLREDLQAAREELLTLRQKVDSQTAEIERLREETAGNAYKTHAKAAIELARKSVKACCGYKAHVKRGCQRYGCHDVLTLLGPITEELVRDGAIEHWAMYKVRRDYPGKRETDAAKALGLGWESGLVTDRNAESAVDNNPMQIGIQQPK